jgi:hypothetical protein
MMSRDLRSLALGLCDELHEDGKQPRVLVVESRPDVRAPLCRELHRLGCATMEARTPLETIRLVEGAGGLVHAVAIGPTLTQTRADELATFLNEAYPDLPVVIVEDIRPYRTRDFTNGLRRAVSGVRDSFASHPLAPAAG